MTGVAEVRVRLHSDAVTEIGEALRQLLADVFTLYMKTKSFHWHMTGRHFRDHHLLLDEHADQLIAMTDVIAERARKIGTTSLRSIGDITAHHRLDDSNDAFGTPMTMLAELRADNQQLTHFLHETHDLCDTRGDIATASLIENWIDHAEHRVWFLSEIERDL